MVMRVVLNLLKIRLTSCLQNMLSFPLGFALLLHNDAGVRAKHLSWMKECYEAWLRFSGEVGPLAAVREILGRSWFHFQFVREVFAHCVAADFQE
eukprot:7888285-Lingulodinium_polyedra.AAC.1